jgi:hypothetical protein
MPVPKKNDNLFKPKRFNVQVDGSFLVGTGVLSMDEYFYDSNQPLWHRVLIKIVQTYTFAHNKKTDKMQRVSFQNPYLVSSLFKSEKAKSAEPGTGIKGKKTDEYNFHINHVQKALKVIKDLGAADMYYVGTAGTLVHHSELPNGGITERRIVPNTKRIKGLLRVIKNTTDYDQLPTRGRERRLANACPFKLEIDELIDSLIETEVADLNAKRKVYNRYAMALAKRYEKKSILNNPDIDAKTLDELLQIAGNLIHARTLQLDPPDTNTIS